MGSLIEINDTLKLKRGEGFPDKIEIGKQYFFRIDEKRLFHLKPVRVFLVEEIDGLWNYKGHAVILEQTIDAIQNETRGIFEAIAIYPKEYSMLANKFEAPAGKAFAE